MFNSKAIKMYYVITIHMQSYPMSSYSFKLIKIYYILPILYVKLIISWISSIKVRLILIILLYLKVS